MKEEWFDGIANGMTDTERLVRAARIAGVATDDTGWNPLTDDGDALRLAVKVRLSVIVEHDKVWIAYYGYANTASPLWYEMKSDDPFAAARRAIVTAAAFVEHAQDKLNEYRREV